MSEREDQSGDKEIGTCHICGRTFSTQEELSKHLMDEHAGERLRRARAIHERRAQPDIRRVELERQLQARLDALDPAPRAELLPRPLDASDVDRPRGDRLVLRELRDPYFAELLIDCEEDGALRAADNKPWR